MNLVGGGFRLPCVTPEPEVQDVDYGAGDEGQRQAQKENPSDVRADEQHEAGILNDGVREPHQGHAGKHVVPGHLAAAGFLEDDAAGVDDARDHADDHGRRGGGAHTEYPQGRSERPSHQIRDLEIAQEPLEQHDEENHAEDADEVPHFPERPPEQVDVRRRGKGDAGGRIQPAERLAGRMHDDPADDGDHEPDDGLTDERHAALGRDAPFGGDAVRDEHHDRERRDLLRGQRRQSGQQADEDDQRRIEIDHDARGPRDAQIGGEPGQLHDGLERQGQIADPVQLGKDLHGDADRNKHLEKIEAYMHSIHKDFAQRLEQMAGHGISAGVIGRQEGPSRCTPAGPETKDAWYIR